jgi:dephospho-CoA kinase
MSPGDGTSTRRRCCAVGLTGGLASGKSTVARILGDLGVPVLDADRVVHDLYRPGAPGAQAVEELFGPDMLDAEGGVDRGALGRLVLSDPASRRRLEARVHPLVRERIGRWLGERPPDAPAVVEAALMVETGSWRAYDVMMVVWCSSQQQLDRARMRGLSPDRVDALLEAQLPLEAKREYADVVVDNTGDLEDLFVEVERAWREVTARCAARRDLPQSPAGSSHSVA